MYLNCCHQRLAVLLEDDLRDDDNQPTYGLHRPGVGLILDSTTPPSERRIVLVHELSHAYEHYMGRVDSDDEEGRQTRTGSIECQFAKDLADQGGEAVIHALFGDIDAFMADADLSAGAHYTLDDEAAEWPTSVCCPSCYEQYPSRAIKNGKPTFNPRINAFMLKRLLACGKCGRETRWGQRCTYDGLPLPDVVLPASTRAISTMT